MCASASSFFPAISPLITLWVKGWNLFYEISEKRRKLYYAKMSFENVRRVWPTQVMLMEWQKLNANTSLYFPLFTVILMKEMQYVDS